MSTKEFVSPVLSWTEKEFQEQVVQAAKVLGWMVYHTFNSKRSEPGFPDLVMVHERKNLILYRELKTQKGKTTVDQDKWLGVLAAVGSDAGVWRPKDWVSGQVQAELNQSDAYLDIVLPYMSRFRTDESDQEFQRNRLNMWKVDDEPGI